MNWMSLIFVAPAWAATAAGGGEPHGAPFSQIIFPLINFLIFFYLLKRFVFPTVRDHLRSRRETIVTEVQEAEASRTEAESQLQQYRSHLSRLQEEAERIHQTIREDAEREKDKLLRDARELAEKIKADANSRAEQEFRIARQELREEMARMAEIAVVEALQKHQSPEDQRRWVEEFVEGIGGTR